MRGKRRGGSGIKFHKKKRRRNFAAPGPPPTSIQVSHTECCICKKPEDPELGAWYSDVEKNIAAHQFCLLFSCGLPQGGNDQDGFDGFLVPDILKEVRRVRTMACKYCLQYSASSGCYVKSCQMTYHYKCGVENDAQFDFHGTFNTYCYEHRSFQDVDFHNGSTIPSCPICLDEIDEYNLSIIKMPCCINVYAHKQCVQHQANASGYFFRCPTCKNEKKFKREMERYGIYIPQRDATWEENNAFSDLLQQYKSCDLPTCKCPNGQNFEEEDGKWELIRCEHCGQGAVHRHCLGKRSVYVCRDCDHENQTFAFLAKKSEEAEKIQKELIKKQLAKGDPLVSQIIFCPEKTLKKFNIKPCFVKLTKLPDAVVSELKQKGKRLRRNSSAKSKPEHFHKRRSLRSDKKEVGVDSFSKSISNATSTSPTTTKTTGKNNQKGIDLASEPTHTGSTSEEEQSLAYIKAQKIIENGNNVKSTYSFSSDSANPFTISTGSTNKSEVAKIIEKKINDSVNLAKAQGNGRTRVNFIPCRSLFNWVYPLHKKNSDHEDMVAPSSYNKKDQELISNVSETDSEIRDQYWVTDDESSIRTANTSPPLNGNISPRPMRDENLPLATDDNVSPILDEVSDLPVLINSNETTLIDDENVPLYDQIDVKEEELSPCVVNTAKQFTFDGNEETTKIATNAISVIDEKGIDDDSRNRRSLSEGDVDDVIIINAASKKSRNTKNRLKTRSVPAYRRALKTKNDNNIPCTTANVKEEPTDSYDPRTKITYYANGKGSNNNSSTTKRKRKKVEDDTKNTFIESWLKKERTSFAAPIILNNDSDDSDDFVNSSVKIRRITDSPCKNVKSSPHKNIKSSSSKKIERRVKNNEIEENTNDKPPRLKKNFLRVKLRNCDS